MFRTTRQERENCSISKKVARTGNLRRRRTVSKSVKSRHIPTISFVLKLVPKNLPFFFPGPYHTTNTSFWGRSITYQPIYPLRGKKSPEYLFPPPTFLLPCQEPRPAWDHQLLHGRSKKTFLRSGFLRQGCVHGRTERGEEGERGRGGRRREEKRERLILSFFVCLLNNFEGQIRTPLPPPQQKKNRRAKTSMVITSPPSRIRESLRSPSPCPDSRE